MYRKCSAYTLMELLITVALVALLAGIAIPSFATISANGRIRTETDALFHAMHLARKESIVRRQVVSLCPSDDGQQCSASNDWSNGWLMFENSDRDEPPRVDGGEPVLQTHRTARNIQIAANRRGFTLRATHKRATNGTLFVCDRLNRGTPRALVVSYTGRPRISRENRKGKPFQCPG